MLQMFQQVSFVVGLMLTSWGVYEALRSKKSAAARK